MMGTLRIVTGADSGTTHHPSANADNLWKVPPTLAVTETFFNHFTDNVIDSSIGWSSHLAHADHR